MTQHTGQRVKRQSNAI